MNATARLLAYTLLATVAIAVAVFPSVEPERFASRDPLGETVDRAHARYRLQSELMRRAHSRELARAAASRTESAHAIFAVDRPSDVPEVFVQRVGSLVRALEHPAPRDSTVRVVITFAIDTGESVAGTPAERASGVLSMDVFPPGTVAHNACVVVVHASDAEMLAPVSPLPPPGRRRIGSGLQYLSYDGRGGPCAWYAKYGIPGRAIARWLDSTGYGALNADTHGSWFSYNLITSHLGSGPFSFGDLQFGACYAGRTHACEAMVLGVRNDNGWQRIDGAVGTPGWTGAGRRPPGNSNAIAARMLTELESELGPAGFARFWKSDAPVAVAFAAATGEPLGAWMSRDIRMGATSIDVRAGRVYHAGPLPTPIVCVGLVFMVPLVLTLGVRAVARRGEFA
jgi:hypothetical protein